MNTLRSILPEKWHTHLARYRPLLLRVLIVAGALLLSALLGYTPPLLSPFLWAAGLSALLVGLLAFRSTIAVLTALVATSALVNFSLSTGTQSPIHFSLLVVILCTGVWILRMLVDKNIRLSPTPANRPLLLFNLAVLLSWAAGYAFWKPTVPRPDNAFTVQAGQVAMFVLSATAFFLAANHPLRKKDIQIWNGIIIALGIVAVLMDLLQGGSRPEGITGGLLMWPFALLWAQLLFNPTLPRWLHAAGWLSLPLWGLWVWRYALNWKGGWIPALLALATLVLLRSRRWFALFAVVSIAFIALTWSTPPSPIPQPGLQHVPTSNSSFWSTLLTPEQQSGSFLRFPIWYDILCMTARSPVLGLGPANYMYYWRDPAFYSYSLANSPNWWAWFYYGYAPPSHNMYVDILAQFGVVGLVLFLWAIVALLRLAYQALHHLPEGFLSAYARGVMAGFVAMLVASFAFADWLIPFVYNITIKGFQHSVYSWLLLGSLVPLMQHYGSAEHAAYGS